MIKMVVDHPLAAETDLSSLRWVIYGGAPMYVEDLRKALSLVRQRLRAALRADRVAHDRHHPAGRGAHARRPAGPPARLLRPGPVRRRRSASSTRTTGLSPPGEIGEICIRGGSVMKGYWERPEETAETLRGGWLHTGDIGKMDEDGYVYILDRTKDMVISGGLNIYPREIEEVLLTHPSVSEACVFGVPDDKWGEALQGPRRPDRRRHRPPKPRSSPSSASAWPATRSRRPSSSSTPSPRRPTASSTSGPSGPPTGPARTGWCADLSRP